MKSLGMKAVYGLVLSSMVVLAGNTAQAGVAVTMTPSSGVNNNGQGFSLGFLFTVNSAINVTELGYYDHNGDGFATSHEVGIYDTSANLLVSTTVTSADPLDNLFRYHAISSTYLAAGQYVIAGVTGTQDFYAWNPTTFSTAPEITFNENRLIQSPILAFPTNTVLTTNEGNFGPNFKFENAGPVVPEPSALISAAIAGVIGLGVARRRRSA